MHEQPDGDSKPDGVFFRIAVVFHTSRWVYSSNTEWFPFSHRVPLYTCVQSAARAAAPGTIFGASHAEPPAGTTSYNQFSAVQCNLGGHAGLPSEVGIGDVSGKKKDAVRKQKRVRTQTLGQ